MENPFLPLLPSNYAGDDWNLSPPPLLPTPDPQQERVPPTFYGSAVMPDEQVGDQPTPWPFATTPLPELTYNPYPVQTPATLPDSTAEPHGR